MSFLLDHPDLLRGFKAGDRRALTEVYRHYLPLVSEIVRHGFVFESKGQTLRFGGAGQSFEVDDLIADIFVRAFRPAARDAYDGLRPYAQYLKTIARNAIIDRLRARSSKLAASAQFDEEQAVQTSLSGEVAGPEEALEHKEMLQLAQEFIATLPERERGVVQKRFVEAKIQTQAADELGLSAPTVRKLERKIVRCFFKFMKQRGYFEQHPNHQRLGSFLASTLALVLVLQNGLS